MQPESSISREIRKTDFLDSENGLVADKTLECPPASIAATGLSLPVYRIGVERDEALRRTLAVLRFFDTSPKGTEREGTVYKVSYDHYLDMNTGKRAFRSELWTVDAASLPLAPEAVLPAIEKFNDLKLKEDVYGYKASYNPTFTHQDHPKYGRVSRYHFGINQAATILMTENYRNGFVWNLMKRCSYILDGLRKAGFRGGWLSA